MKFIHINTAIARNVRNLWILRRDCMRNCHSAVLNIAKWAQEYFRKLLSLNTVNCSIKKCKLKLYYARKKPHINSIKKHCQVLWARAHLRWSQRNVCAADESMFQLVFWEKRTEFFMPKNKASRLLSAKGPKAKISHGMGPSVPTVWLTCIHVKVPLMQRSVSEF